MPDTSEKSLADCVRRLEKAEADARKAKFDRDTWKAERDRYREALESISRNWPNNDDYSWAGKLARRALAGEAT